MSHELINALPLYMQFCTNIKLTCLRPAKARYTTSSFSVVSVITSICNCSSSKIDSILRPQYKHFASVFSSCSLIISISPDATGRVYKNKGRTEYCTGTHNMIMEHYIIITKTN